MNTGNYSIADTFDRRPAERWWHKPMGGLIMLALIAVPITLFWNTAYKVGTEDARHDTLQEVARLAEDHTLLLDFLRREGY